MIKKKYLCLFANCLIVKGFYRSLICDTQRGRFYFVPNSLYYLFKNNSYVNLERLRLKMISNDLEILNEYIEFLEINELIFYSNSLEEVKAFPKLSLDWDFPALITNCIIDLNSKNFFNKTIKQLGFLGCRYIQLRCQPSINLKNSTILPVSLAVN